MTTIRDLTRQASDGPSHDLWPVLCARLAGDGRVELRLPALGWPVALAAAAALAVVLLVPEPLRFLTASGIL